MSTIKKELYEDLLSSSSATLFKELESSLKDGSASPKKNKMKVQFDSSVFLDQLFKKALKLAFNQQGNSRLSLEENFKISVGIDIVCYGAYNSKMAYLITDENNPDNISFGAIEMSEDHIGNLKVLSDYTRKEICFIEQFHSIIRSTFHCFGKRWYELKDEDLKLSKNSSYKIVERKQFPCIYFDESRCYSANEIVSKYFEAMLKCLNINLNESTPKLKSLCVTIPSDFHSYQRLALKSCFESIGLKKFILVNKSTSLALPFLAKNLSDSSKKFILDFGSGYMNCSIVQLTKKNKLTVIDQLADKSISSKAFFDNCFLNLKQQMRQQSLKGIKSQMRYDLYQVMNNDANPNSDTIKETWNVNTMGSTIQLNMKSLGAEEIASSVLEKLKRTSLVDKKTSKVVEEINDILICSDAVIYEYLEPLLRHYCNPKTQITFIDNDCSVLGASFLASGLLKVKTFDLLPFPIGMGLYNGVNKFLIEPKTSFPCIGENIFQTITNNQKTIRVNVYEGESTLARNCKQICEIVIDNLRPAPAGRVKLNIQIEFDENGVLKAFATDLATKKELEVFIDIYSLNFLEFKRDPNEYQVDIDQKLNHTIIARDYHIAKFLEDLDFYLEYLLDTYNFSPQRTRSFIERKIYLAKKYVSKNRLKIGISECNQLADELEQIVNTNKPSNLDKKELDLYDKKNITAICTIL